MITISIGADSQSRKWQLTINNPVRDGYTHAWLKELLNSYKSVVYWCMSDEIGLEEEIHHTHVYMAFSSAVRFSSIKNKFTTAHIEMCRGTSQENKDYVFKEGPKWSKDKKEGTNLRDTHEEYGQMPVERPGARNDLADLYDMIKQGMTNYEVIESCPHYMFNVDKIERVRQIVREEKYKTIFRQLEITYVYGKTGSGKTRDVLEQYGYENVYRITDYLHPFDGYKGQDVVIFEEFRSSLKIQEMLNYMDGYPLELPCRYANKVACYTKLYIITNISLEMQYTSVQTEHKETWKAFLRRIGKIKKYSLLGATEYYYGKDCIEQLDIEGLKEVERIFQDSDENTKKNDDRSHQE